MIHVADMVAGVSILADAGACFTASLAARSAKGFFLRIKVTHLYHEYFKATANADSVFRYSTMQFNRDYAAALHIDRNNEGPSYSIGLGG
jgi:hypothetical protein